MFGVTVRKDTFLPGPGPRSRTLWLWSAGCILSLLAPSVFAATVDPLLTIGSATTLPGGTVHLPITLTGSMGNVAGLVLSLAVEADSDAPPITVTISKGADTPNWYLYEDPQDPLRFTMADNQGVSTPAEVAALQVTLSPDVKYSARYAITVQSAVISDNRGHERNLTAQSRGGVVSTPLVYGDLTRDGQLAINDVQLALSLLLGLRSTTAGELRAGDVRPKQGITMGNGRIGANDVNWILRRLVGLEANP